jgi:hypothetical protein
MAEFEGGDAWSLCVVDDVVLVYMPSGRTQAVRLPPEVFE